MTYSERYRDRPNWAPPPKDPEPHEKPAARFVYEESIDELVQAELDLEKCRADLEKAKALFSREPDKVHAFVRRVIEGEKLLKKRKDRHDRCRKILLEKVDVS